MDEAPKVRSDLILNTFQYIEAHYPPAAREALVLSLPPSVRATLESGRRGQWVPRADIDMLWSWIAARHEDPNERVQVLLAVGRAIGDGAATTFLRLLLKLLTPSMFARKLGEFWLRYHDFGSCVAEPVTGQSLAFTIRGLEGYPWLVPCAAGWVAVAFERMGLHDVVIDFDRTIIGAPPDAVTYHVTWAT